METKLQELFIKILNEEVVIAEGCTEPVAIAYVTSIAYKYLEDKSIKKIDCHLSGNMIKNVKSVIVPRSYNNKGVETAVAMGILSKKDDGFLQILTDVDKAELEEILNKKNINVIHFEDDIKLYIKIDIFTESGESVSVEVKHVHTNITKVIHNNKVLINRPCIDADFNSSLLDRTSLSIENIYNFANDVNLELIKDLLESVILNNKAIAHEGLTKDYGAVVGKTLRGYYGSCDAKRTASTYAAAGSDARMNGSSLPVMTTSGSGNQGMTASLPLISYSEHMNISHDKLLRALAFSHLTTVHIKTNIGRLSAYCGVVCASSAVSGALAYINNDSFKVISDSITNTLGNVSGIICDGAKSSCAMKINTTISSAFDSYVLAKNGHVLSVGDGIIGDDIEETIKSVGYLASVGMNETDNAILEIMTNRQS